MDGEIDESISYMIADLAVFYKGSISYAELEDMPIPKLHNLNKFADKMIEEAKRESKDQQRRMS